MAFMVGLEAPLFHQNSNMTTTSHLHRPSLFPSPNSISLPHIATSQISLRRLKLKTPKSKVYAASTPVLPITPTPSTPLFNSTRSVSSIIALALSISKLFSTAIQGIPLKLQQFGMIPTPYELASIQSLKQNLVCTTGPLFFAAMRGTRLNTPLTVVAAGMAKWLEIYGGLLMVRVLLSWFPNIPWDRQPLSAIRDLCDPYLNLFRNIIPPVFNTLDVSPLLAFAVMGVMGSILSNSTLA